MIRSNDPRHTHSRRPSGWMTDTKRLTLHADRSGSSHRGHRDSDDDPESNARAFSTLSSRWKAAIPTKSCSLTPVVTAVAVIGLASLALFCAKSGPLLFMLIPYGVVAAFRLRVAGAALACFAMIVVTASFTLWGHGPIAFFSTEAPSRFLRLFAGAVALTIYPVALAIKRRDAMAAQVADSEARIRRLLELVPSALFRVGRDGKLIDANAAFARLVGIPVDVAASIKFADLVPASRGMIDRTGDRSPKRAVIPSTWTSR